MKQLTLYLLLVFSVPLCLHAKDYRIVHADIQSVVHSDGSIIYTELRTYYFQGSFSQADYIMPRRGFTEIRDIQVAENGVAYTRTDRGREEGTFYIAESSSRIEIVWNFRAKDEYRTFEISYVLDGALIVGPDYSEFTWTYLSNRWERQTEQLTVNFVLDAGDEDTVHNWVRGAADRIRLRATQNGFELNSNAFISRNSIVEVRSVFPSSVVADAAVTHPDFSLQTALDQEEDRALLELQRAERRAIWVARGQVTGWILILLSLASFISIYIRHGRWHQFGSQAPIQLYEPPMLIPPAVAGKMLYSSGTEAYLLTATLFDLARRGYFKLFETTIKQKSAKAKPKQTLVIQFSDESPSTDNLLSYERHMVDFLTKAMIANRVSLAALFESDHIGKAQKERNPGLYDMNIKSREVTTWYQDWIKELTTYMTRFKWYEPNSTKWMVVNMMIQAVLTSGAVILLVQAFVPVVMIALMLCIVMFIMSMAIRRRTPEAQLEHDKWVAYRKGLIEGRPQDLQSGDASYHLIYAIALFITGKKFVRAVEGFSTDSTSLEWIYFSHVGVFNPAFIASSVSNITASTTSSFSAGGASVGVAGGGAGGGAR
jgi:uncharacterized membrane protein